MTTTVRSGSLGPRLFEAKLRVPATGKSTLNRPRLFSELDRSAECRLVVVSAPAGFGKTTLVASWLKDRCPGLSADSRATHQLSQSFRFAWVSLDDRENDLHRLVAYLIAALSSAFPELHFSTASLLHAIPAPPVEHYAQTLVADLEQLPEDMTLVLDDYHLMHEQAVHELVELLVAYSPDRFRLILIGRHDPPLPITRLFLQGKALRLRASDLRFQDQEAEQFLELALPDGVPDDTRRSLAAQAGGWIAQLRLAALLFKQWPDQLRLDVLPSGAMDYAVDELLAHEAPEVRAFLLMTSVLERFCTPLVEALLDGDIELGDEQCEEWLALARTSNVAALFKKVVRDGLFVTELGGTLLWLRYHDLFRELLFLRLQTECPAMIPLLRRRAFAWLAKAGFVEEALAHAQALNDAERIASLVEQHVLGVVQAYQWQTVDRWVNIVPLDAARHRPAILLARGLVLANAGAFDSLGKVINDAEALLSDTPEKPGADEQRLLKGTLELLRSEYCLVTNQVEASYKAASAALHVMPERHEFQRAFATIRLASALAHQGKLDEARQALSREVDRTHSSSPHLAFRLRLALAFIHTRRADLCRTKQELDLIEQVYLGADQAYNACWLHYALGRLEWEWNDLEAAEKHWRMAARAPGGNLLRGFESLMGLALIAQFRGNPQGADMYVEQAAQIAAVMGGDYLGSTLASFRHRLAIMRGRVPPAPAVALSSIDTDPGLLYLPIEIARFTEARRLIKMGRPSGLIEAQRMLQEAVEFFESNHTTFLEIPARALLAVLYRTQGRKGQALSTLSRAIELAAPGRYMRTFLDLGPDLTGLLYELGLSGAAGELVSMLLSDAAKEGPVSSRTKTTQKDVEPLTTRELAVLALLAEDLSDKEIAQSLTISPLTVRKHTGNIFAKLQVRNRRQAATRAIELGLVRPKVPGRS